MTDPVHPAKASSPIRVRFLTSHFLPDSVGGGETHTFHAARELLSRGHDVRIWRTTRAGAPTASYSYHGVPVEVLPPGLEKSEAASEAWLKGAIETDPVDVVHVMVSGECRSILASVARRLPVVVTLLDFHYWCSQGLRRHDGRLCHGPESLEGCHQCLAETDGRIHHVAPLWRSVPRPIQKLSAKLPRLTSLESRWAALQLDRTLFDLVKDGESVFVAPSPIMRRLAERAGVARDRIVDLPYGVSDQFIQSAGAKSVSETLRVGFFGRLVAEKGVDVLIRAVTALPEPVRVEVRLFGNTPAEHRAYADQLKLIAGDDPRVEFCGVIEQDRVAREHRDLDVVVIPSRWHENATITLLESLALGTPVIATDVEGMAPFITSGVNGFTFPVDDVIALRDRLYWCAEHRTRLAEMASSCGPLLSARAHAQELESVYVRSMSRCR